MELNEQYEHQQYAEEQYERTANGLEEETLIAWKHRKIEEGKLFAELRAIREAS